MMEELRVDMRKWTAEDAAAGAAAVVTHDVGDYKVVVGNPAKVIRTLDAERFNKV